MSSVDIGIEEIQGVLPHRPPFLFVDRVVELVPGKHILAQLTLRSDAPHFAGHFPGKPIMPGVLIAEALAQTAGLLHGLSSIGPAPGALFYLARTDMKWTAPCYPGETLNLAAKLVREMGGLLAFSVRAYLDRADVATGSLTLAAARENG